MSQKLAIMQPYFFPYLGYYQLLVAADVFVVLDDVAFINRGWINRNNILLNGAPHLFTVPLKDASQNRIIKDIETAEQANWRKKLLKLLTHAYLRAPMFRPAFSGIEDLILGGEQKISRLASASIRLMRDMHNLSTRLIFSSALEYNRALKGEAKIIEICNAVNAATYINPIGGKELYRSKAFEKRGIELLFLKSAPVRYRQFESDRFVPNLSMIDVLMFNKAEHVAGLLDQYSLVAQEEA